MSRAAIVAVLALSGCASFSPDSGFAPVQQAAQQHLGQSVAWARSDADRQRIAERVDALLARPLGMDDIVEAFEPLDGWEQVKFWSEA